MQEWRFCGYYSLFSDFCCNFARKNNFVIFAYEG